MNPPLTLLAMSIPVWVATALACWPSRAQREHYEEHPIGSGKCGCVKPRKDLNPIRRTL